MIDIVKRELSPEILKWLDDKRIIIIKGARRTDKTTLLNQIKDYLKKQHKKVIMFSADQEFDNPIFQNSKSAIIFTMDYLDKKENVYFIPVILANFIDFYKI